MKNMLIYFSDKCVILLPSTISQCRVCQCCSVSVVDRFSLCSVSFSLAFAIWAIQDVTSPETDKLVAMVSITTFVCFVFFSSGWKMLYICQFNDKNHSCLCLVL